ncbi:MAG TPA: sensor histidine kinase [Azospirillum sp.]|nr:sensor histidine kinase [Azospirillum sp.]
MWRDMLKRGIHVLQMPDMNTVGASLPAAMAVPCSPWPAGHGVAATMLACAGDDGSGEARDSDHLKARIAELEAELARAELLMRETNHRAKNAFATISSLVAMELTDVRDPQARKVLQLTQERLAAVALVHEALQGKNDDAMLDLGALLHRLITAVAFSMGAEGRGIQVRVAAPSVPVDASRAVALALVANELVTNALKYAFIGRTGGYVELALRKSTGKLLLRVRDDGIGVRDHRRKADGTGLGLVRRLAEQIGARIRFGHRDGTTVTVSIPYAG